MSQVDLTKLTQLPLFGELERLRTCKDCGEKKSLDEFYEQKKVQRGRLTKHRWKRCNLCVLKRHRDWKEKNPDKWKMLNRRKDLRTAYGISIEEYNTMLESQGGVCAICRNPETAIVRRSKSRDVRPLAVDHNHETGKIRALLCSRCNSGLGGFRDDPSLLMAAVAYIEHFACGG